LPLALLHAQAFTTGTLQNYARRNQLPIDAITFAFETQARSKEQLHSAGKDAVPAAGAYVDGMFLEGARWDFDVMQLGESKPKELFTKVGARCGGVCGVPVRRLWRDSGCDSGVTLVVTLG
jgi:hypothetical protein